MVCSGISVVIYPFRGIPFRVLPACAVRCRAETFPPRVQIVVPLGAVLASRAQTSAMGRQMSYHFVFYLMDCGPPQPVLSFSCVFAVKYLLWCV